MCFTAFHASVDVGKDNLMLLCDLFFLERIESLYTCHNECFLFPLNLVALKTATSDVETRSVKTADVAVESVAKFNGKRKHSL